MIGGMSGGGELVFSRSVNRTLHFGVVLIGQTFPRVALPGTVKGDPVNQGGCRPGAGLADLSTKGTALHRTDQGGNEWSNGVAKLAFTNLCAVAGDEQSLFGGAVSVRVAASHSLWFISSMIDRVRSECDHGFISGRARYSSSA